MEETSRFIKFVSEKSDRYGNELINMMDYYGVNNLATLTLPEIKEYLRIRGWLEEPKD